jgi:ribosomal protein L3 glutamine methyltransferase
MTAARRRAPAAAQAGTRMRTVRDLVRYAVRRFEAAQLSFGHGTGNSFDEAVWLVLWALHLPLESLDPFLDAALTSGQRSRVIELIDRRCLERVPLAYITGEAWLGGRHFIADPRALVPRSPIAEAIDETADESTGDFPPRAPARILDLCTGGASLAILAALKWPEASVVASDASADALALARANVELYGLGTRIELLQGDLFDPVRGRAFDLILCNPPYVNQASMESLPAEYRAEPISGLAGGDDGMRLIGPIIEQAPAHLTPDGGLLLEIGHERLNFEAACRDFEFSYIPVTAGEDQLVWVTRAQLVERR